VWTVRDGRIYLSYANRAFLDSKGLKMGREALGEPVDKILPTATRRQAIRTILAAAEGEVQQVDRVVEDAAGRSQIERVTIRLLRDSPEIEVLGIGMVVPSRSRPKGAANDPATDSLDFRALFDDLPTPIAVWSNEIDDARLIYCNDAYRELWLRMQGEQPGQMTLRAATDRAGIDVDSTIRSLNEGRPQIVRAERPDAEGEHRRLATELRPVGSPVPAYFVATVLDVDAAAKLARETGERTDMGLTGRQYEVLRQISLGLSTPQVAAALGISPETVKWHVKEILRRTGARTRAEAVAMMLREK